MVSLSFLPALICFLIHGWTGGVFCAVPFKFAEGCDHPELIRLAEWLGLVLGLVTYLACDSIWVVRACTGESVIESTPGMRQACLGARHSWACAAVLSFVAGSALAAWACRRRRA